MHTPLYDRVIKIWSHPDARPKFIRYNYCNGRGQYCPHGHVLHLAGLDDSVMTIMNPHTVDTMVSEFLGIPYMQAVMLRYLNDSETGLDPADVLTDPTGILGPNADAVLAVWSRFDRHSSRSWRRMLEDLDSFKATINFHPAYNKYGTLYQQLRYACMSLIEKKLISSAGYWLPLKVTLDVMDDADPYPFRDMIETRSYS